MDVRAFPSESHPDESILLSPSNLRVVRGDAELLAHAAHAGIAGNGEEAAQIDAIRTALTQEAPQIDEAYEEIVQLNIGNTYHCNMACTYCYNELPNKERKGSEVPDGMTRETAREMVDALFRQLGTESRVVSLVFIGGESLVEKSVLFETVNYARARGDEVGITVCISVYTNGTLMDSPFVDWALEHKAHLFVSLDGPPSVNDRHRVFPNGRPTSKPVLRNIRRMMDAVPRGLKATVTAVTSAPGELLPLAKYLLALGFNNIQIQAAYGLDGFGDRGSVSDLSKMQDWYRSLLLDGTVIGLAPFTNTLKRLVGRNRAIHPCNAGSRALGVAPSGDLYPCHHFLEQGEFRLGNVRDGLPRLAERRPYFQSVAEREPCRQCWARHICGGECFHRAHTAGVGYAGVIEEVCDGRRHGIGLTLDLFAEVASIRPDVLRQLHRDHFSLVPIVESAYSAQDLMSFGAEAAPAGKRSLPIVSHG